MVVHICFPALSKPHLLEGKGHNRQASDSSVDRFIPKDEVLEPVDLDNKVKTHTHLLDYKYEHTILIMCKKNREWYHECCICAVPLNRA